MFFFINALGWESTRIFLAVPFQYKRNLTRCLAVRARKIYGPEAFNMKMEYKPRAMKTNSEPDRFVRRWITETKYQSRTQVARAKEVCIATSFNRDKPFELLVYHMTKAT